MDVVQVVIIVISTILTILFVAVSIQVFLILKEIRVAMRKMNTMLDDVSKVTGSVGETVTGMSGLFHGLRAGLSLFSNIRKKEEDYE